MKQQLTLLFIVLSIALKAQVFPVQVTPVVVPPYSVVLSEYGNAFRDQVIVNLLLSDILANRDVRLEFSLTSNTGINVQSAPVIIGETPFRLSGGTPLRLSSADLQPYFQLENLVGISPQQYASPLPDGLYNFCFRVIDQSSGQPISRNSCAQAFIRQNDPPFLNYPEKGISITETNPTNIVFNWTPRHLNATNVQYAFTLTELWDEGIDPQTAFFTSPPLYETTTNATTLLYGISEPALLPNKSYAWRVRAVVNDGISQTSTFKNNGFSEIWHFKHNGLCRAPQFGLTVPKTATSQIVRWQYGEYAGYKIQYRKVGGSSTAWFEESAASYEEAVTIYNLEKSTTYEYRIGGQCRAGEDFVYGNSQQFTTASSSEDAGGYQCGALPDVTITNQEPLERLGINETFFAGDFPVTAKFVEQVSTGVYTGIGYVTVPYLADTRILVKFENIAINTDKQLTNGIVETTYDPSWSGVDDISDELAAFGEIIEIVTERINKIKNRIEELFEKEEITPEEKEAYEAEVAAHEKELEEIEESKEEFIELAEEAEKEEKEEGAVNEELAEAKEALEKREETLNTATKELEDKLGENGEVYIVFRTKKYYDGDTISIAYDATIEKENLELFGANKQAKIVWDIYANASDVSVTSVIPNEGKLINYQLMRPASEFYLGVEYWNKRDEFPEKDKMQELRVKVEINNSQEFNFKELYAVDANNNKRLAKSGETLYLLKSQGITSPNDRKRTVNYSIITNPNLQPNSFNERDIEWDYTDVNGTRQYDYGKMNISRVLSESDNTNVTNAIVGFPDKETKHVDVEWFERLYFKSKYTVGSSTNSFLKKALELTELTKKYSEKLDKIPFLKKARKNERISNGIGFYFNVTPFQKIVENKEDKNSRLYYTKRTIEGGFDVGLSGSTKWTLFGIPYEKLPGPQWVKDKAREYVVAEVYISASANAGGELKAKQLEHKYAESNKWKTISSGVDPALIKLNVALKAGAEISLLKGDSKKIKNDEDEFKWFTLHGSASGTANAELLSIGWVDGNDPKIYYLRKGVWIDIRTNLYAIVVGKKFEVEPFYNKIEIIQPPTEN